MGESSQQQENKLKNLDYISGYGQIWASDTHQGAALQSVPMSCGMILGEGEVGERVGGDCVPIGCTQGMIKGGGVMEGWPPSSQLTLALHNLERTTKSDCSASSVPGKGKV